MMGSPSNNNNNTSANANANVDVDVVGDESQAAHQNPSCDAEGLPPNETKPTAPPKPSTDADTQRETYTIPSCARWFSWNKIHETEHIALKEFFNGSASSKTPKIYKEYRDFMINIYRDDPLKRVTFTEIRKMLVGDVNSLRKIFDFLDTWGLINFQAPPDFKLQSKNYPPIVLDNVTPNGIRVVSPPKSAKHMMSPTVKSKKLARKAKGEQGVTLASYKDVFELKTETKTSAGAEKQSTVLERQFTAKYFCNNCRAECTASRFDCQKAGFVLCTKCFEDGNYGLGLCAADFRRHDLHQETSETGADGWTDQETLLLLEATMLYSDDWKSIVQHVGTKNEADCVMKLIQLPFGEQFIGNAGIEGIDRRSSNVRNENKTDEQAFSLKDSCAQNYLEADSEEDKHTTEDDVSGPPLKRRHLTPLMDASNAIMGQVAFLSTMVGPRVAAAAAEAAIAALCEEDPSASQIIRNQEPKLLFQKNKSSPNELELTSMKKPFQREEQNNEPEGTDQDLKGDPHSSANVLPATHLQMRAAIATALGAAGAHAKILADQEEREIEHLMSIIIENQLKKVHLKIRHFEELEVINEKDYTLMEHIKEFLISERIHIIRETLNAGEISNKILSR